MRLVVASSLFIAVLDIGHVILTQSCKTRIISWIFLHSNWIWIFSECVEQYYRILYRVCEYTEELKQELRQAKNERDQMSEDLIKAENAYTDVKKRNEKLKLIINEHKTVGHLRMSSRSHLIDRCLEHGNIEKVLGRIRSIHRRTETEICCAQTTCTGEIE